MNLMRIVALAAIACSMPAMAERGLAQSAAPDQDQAARRWICRAATDVQNENATMTNAERTALICKPLRIEVRMSNSTMVRIGSTHAKPVPDGPDLSHALTPAQINDAWARFLKMQFGESTYVEGG
jgi:hypothetical protein